jgi:hypothetical protein
MPLEIGVTGAWNMTLEVLTVANFGLDEGETTVENDPVAAIQPAGELGYIDEG